MALFRKKNYVNETKTKRRTIFSPTVSMPVKILRGVIYAFTLYFIMSGFIARSEIVRSGGMAPAIKKNERVWIAPSAYGVKLPFIYSRKTGRTFGAKDPARGDVVLFRDPTKPRPNVVQRAVAFPLYLLTLGFVNIAPEPYLIKRVIGLPNEKVEIKNKTVYVNDAPLDEPWTTVFNDERTLPETVAPRDTSKAFIVPYGSYYVLGDNRDHAYDSRSFRAVAQKDIIGKAIGK